MATNHGIDDKALGSVLISMHTLCLCCAQDAITFKEGELQRRVGQDLMKGLNCPLLPLLA